MGKEKAGIGLELRLNQAVVKGKAFLKVEVKARRRRPLTPGVALVLDRSGSMAGRKLEEAKAAARHLLSALSPKARLGLVAYDHEVTVGGFARQEVAGFLRDLEARGTTALHAGWAKGVEILKDEKRPRVVFLLSDGLANQGLTDPERLAQEAKKAAARGVYTFTLGFGEAYDRHLLAGMAQAGGGTHHYVAQGELLPTLVTEMAFLEGPVNLGVRLALGKNVHHLAPFAPGEERVLLLPVEGEALEVAERLPEDVRRVHLPLPEPTAEESPLWKEAELEVLLLEGAQLLKTEATSPEEASGLKEQAETLLAHLRAHPLGKTPRVQAMAEALSAFSEGTELLAQRFDPGVSDRMAREGLAYSSQMLYQSRPPSYRRRF
ncbi:MULTISPECIES: VWA domain-containing protein [unclassified Meiothermus]|uniref:vWA domain-containing protein n=1 Tax=unclassified Meiothermus TaxID=370471 RepID=UPI000D7BBBAD|nr:MULTISPECIES: VWA domain-containing protein [unclassified Meiothermus]PZA06060.1 hypothetical protein DNA98_15505 [Meiothermus sp. Pnk-1]RYM31414.1 VWA domain-containing protein [Meiothermus sp. PNK-Is4]